MIRRILGLALVAGLVAAGAFAYRKATAHERELEARAQRIAEQRAAIERLTRTRRVAQAVVVERWTDEGTGKVHSRVRFVEVDAEGKPLKTVETVVEGEVVYFDALVLKFDADKVAAGDPVKGRSVILFRRMFGEHQKPSEGIALDEADPEGVPVAYRSRAGASEAERELWSRFWRLANQPEEAKREGVRVAQGEAPYVRMAEDRLYELELDEAGGLNVRASAIPAALLRGDG